MSGLKEELIKKIAVLLESSIGEISTSLPVIKQFNDEEMVAIEWLYPVEQDDAHGERMSQEEVRKMIDSLNKSLKDGKLKFSINHSIYTDLWCIEKAWINECDCYIGETFIPEGWPLVKTRFFNKALWESRKSGALMGLSIGARAFREEVEDAE